MLKCTTIFNGFGDNDCTFCSNMAAPSNSTLARGHASGVQPCLCNGVCTVDDTFCFLLQASGGKDYAAAVPTEDADMVNDADMTDAEEEAAATEAALSSEHGATAMDAASALQGQVYLQLTAQAAVLYLGAASNQ